MTCRHRTDFSGLGGEEGPVNKHALAIREFDRVLERIAERTPTSRGHEYIIQLTPSGELR